MLRSIAHAVKALLARIDAHSRRHEYHYQPTTLVVTA